MSAIEDKKLEAMLRNNIGYDFEIPISTLVDKAVGYGRFKAWCGNDRANIKKVLEGVKKRGFSPTLFTIYERNEGYNSQWGWLNRTHVRGDWLNDALKVADDLIAVSKNMYQNPAWIDVGNYVDFVPSSVKAEGNKDYKENIVKGSIGRCYIAATAAATWEVYYPLGLKKEYNLVRDYGKPLTELYKNIVAWGGVLQEGKEPVKPKPNEPKPYPEPEKKPNVVSEAFNTQKFFKDYTKKLTDEIEKLLSTQIYDYNNNRKMSNELIQVNKMYNNMYKLSLNKSFRDIIADLIDSSLKSLKDVSNAKNPPKEPEKKDPVLNDECGKKIDKFISELKKIPLETLNYQNIRPQAPLNTVKYADCSSFVGWGLRDLHPKVWNNGYLHTGTIYQYFKKNGYLKWQGTFVDLKNQKLEKGDIIEFSDDNTFGAGLEKHVGVMTSATMFIDMNGNGNQERKFTDVYNYYNTYLGFNHTCILKIVKNCEPERQKPDNGKYIMPIKSKYVGFQLNGQQFGNTGWVRPNTTSDFHDGVDFGNSHYNISELVAVADGEIVNVGYASGLECYIILKVKDFYFWYQEFSSNMSNVKVKKGDKVKQGQVIGVGTGYHLHFGVTKINDFNIALASWDTNDGTWLDPINILTDGKCKGNTLKGNNTCFS